MRLDMRMTMRMTIQVKNLGRKQDITYIEGLFAKKVKLQYYNSIISSRKTEKNGKKPAKSPRFLLEKGLVC